MYSKLWSPIGAIVVGLWIMVMPSLFWMPIAVANSHYITGTLVLTFSMIALWEINMHVIKFTIVPGLWLILAFFVLPLPGNGVVLSDSTCAAFIFLFSLLKRKRTQRFGGGWRALFQRHPLHLMAAEKMGSDAAP